jgi:hypothetical protein
VVAAAAVVLVTWSRDDDAPGRPREGVAAQEIEAQASLAPRPVLFGDTVRATVDVILDTDEIDPASVRAAADFSPWAVVGKPDRQVVSAPGRAYVRTTFVLRCLTGTCVPSGNFTVYEFEPGRVSFTRRSGGLSDEDSIAVALPSMRVYTRLAEIATPDDDSGSAPWRTDLVSLPAPTYRVSPGVLVPLLLTGALVAMLGAGVLAYLAWPRRAPAPPPEPRPEPRLEPALSPLEQALVLLENAVRVDGASDQRRALELVAEELENASAGDRSLANAARALAWSEGIPPVQQTTELAARVRAVLDVLEPSRGAHENGDGTAG